MDSHASLRGSVVIKKCAKSIMQAQKTYSSLKVTAQANVIRTHIVFHSDTANCALVRFIAGFMPIASFERL